MSKVIYNENGEPWVVNPKNTTDYVKSLIDELTSLRAELAAMTADRDRLRAALEVAEEEAENYHEVLAGIHDWLGSEDGQRACPTEPWWYKNLSAALDWEIL
ncbi:hypothetical protein CCP3SC15_1610005 [Gammaproteobacteria bacterium]